MNVLLVQLMQICKKRKMELFFGKDINEVLSELNGKF